MFFIAFWPWQHKNVVAWGCTMCCNPLPPTLVVIVPQWSKSLTYFLLFMPLCTLQCGRRWLTATISTNLRHYTAECAYQVGMWSVGKGPLDAALHTYRRCSFHLRSVGVLTRSTAHRRPWCKIAFSMIQCCMNHAIPLRSTNSLWFRIFMRSSIGENIVMFETSGAASKKCICYPRN